MKPEVVSVKICSKIWIWLINEEVTVDIISNKKVKTDRIKDHIRYCS